MAHHPPALGTGELAYGGDYASRRTRGRALQTVEPLTELGLTLVLNMPDWAWARGRPSLACQSSRDLSRWKWSGTLCEPRLPSFEEKRRYEGHTGELAFGPQAYEVKRCEHAHKRESNVGALTAWLRYNAGSPVDDWIAMDRFRDAFAAPTIRLPHDRHPSSGESAASCRIWGEHTRCVTGGGGDQDVSAG